MTAIVGFNYLDGVLMMAETEESLGPDAKSECDKLFRFTFPVGKPATKIGTVLTGGAGNSHLIECANQGLQRLFATKINKKTDLLAILTDFAGKFFRDTMQDYQGFTPPQLEMLIAVNMYSQSQLFRWEGNLVAFVPGHTSIGSGIVQIHPMLRDVQWSGTCENMLFHGIRMMFYAKRAVVGVGGETVAIALSHDGATHSFGTNTTKKIEELVVNFEGYCFKILHLAISNVTAPEENIEKLFRTLAKDFSMYRQCYKELLKPSASQKSEDQDAKGKIR